MKYSLIITSALSMLGFASCTKVVDIDINSSNPQYVIEGEVTDGGVQTVHITRSVNYSEESKYPAVTNATVIISDGADNTDTLEQVTPGHYETNRIHGTPGHTYTLRVIVDGQEFLSSSIMPQPVGLDSLSLIADSSCGEDIKTPVATFQDPSGMRNFYYFIVYKNGVRSKTLFLDNDLVNDGQLVNTSLRDFDAEYNSGDDVRVEMQCVSQTMFDYYFSLQQTIGQSSATPANPVSNISGKGALGYFSAHTVAQRSVIVP